MFLLLNAMHCSRSLHSSDSFELELQSKCLVARPQRGEVCELGIQRATVVIEGHCLLEMWFSLSITHTVSKEPALKLRALTLCQWLSPRSSLQHAFASTASRVSWEI